MASHGVPRNTTAPRDGSEETRKRELQKIQKYKDLDDLVRTKRAAKDYTHDALEKTSELLTENAEYYSIWNYRRLILQAQLESIALDSKPEHQNNIQQSIQQELKFLVPLLRQFPKCYWIWNHRLWVLEQTIARLPRPVARGFWQQELVLVGKMLSLDGRNFHGWGYRREIVIVLESLDEHSLTEPELNYTKKMIAANLSNFSAWHNRSKLCLKVLSERSATDEDRRRMLDDELGLIHRALIDPYDQSLWFYHQNLMHSLDRATAAEGMTPSMSDKLRLEYLQREIDAITELLDEEEECKWIYQALIEYSLILARMQGGMSAEIKAKVMTWLSNLKRLDPLRRGRWEDLETSMNERLD